jgi:hypothetical protein
MVSVVDHLGLAELGCVSGVSERAGVRGRHLVWLAGLGVALRQRLMKQPGPCACLARVRLTASIRVAGPGIG